MLAGGLEPTELLMRTAYLQGLGPLGYSDPEDQQEDGAILRNSSGGDEGREEREVDSKTYEEVTDRQEPSFREREEDDEEEGNGRSQMDSTRDEEDKDSVQLMDESSREGKTDGKLNQKD